MIKKNIIIVGSGISGLLANYILKKKYNTTIIESSKEIGGLLGSIKYKNMYFDYGTHIPFKINHNKIDKILFSKLNKKKWNIFNTSVREGIYNFGKLDQSSGTLDARIIPKKKLAEAQRHLIKKSKKIVFKN